VLPRTCREFMARCMQVPARLPPKPEHSNTATCWECRPPTRASRQQQDVLEVHQQVPDQLPVRERGSRAVHGG
jgi:hypothetical protein